MRLLAILGALLALVGCATANAPAPALAPASYAGPLARVADSGFPERREKAQFFAVVALDGRRIQNALSESVRASAGLGSVIVPMYTSREVPAQPMRVRIIGTHKSGAIIAEALYRTAGQFFSVEGEVDFKPEPDGYYVVTGELTAERSCVWVMNGSTKAPVTEKVCTK